jgi:uncharacterized membrane protein
MALKQWTDRRVEDVVGNLLRIGVLLSAAVVLCGAVIYLAHFRHAPADYRVFRGEPTDLRTLPGIIRNAGELHGRGIIQLGLVMLIATPVARVAFAVFGFAAEGDRMYVVFTLIVLSVLLYSLVGSA